jgi:hypothetical protein
MRCFTAMEGDGAEAQKDRITLQTCRSIATLPPGRPHTSQEELNELVWRSTILCEKSPRAGADRPSVCLTQRAAGLQ